jgi:hypothetical protein
MKTFRMILGLALIAVGVQAQQMDYCIGKNPQRSLIPDYVTFKQMQIDGLTLGGTLITATAAEIDAAADGTVPLANTKVFIGSSGGVAAAQTISGDATLAANGALSLATRSVAGAELPIMTAGQVLAGQADSNALVKTISGAATMDANGVLTIAPTTTVTRLVATTASVASRTPVLSYSGVSVLQLDYAVGCTNGQTVAFAVTFASARPAVVASYSSASTAQTITTNCEVHSITYSNCVVVCEAGKTVDLIAYGIK